MMQPTVFVRRLQIAAIVLAAVMLPVGRSSAFPAGFARSGDAVPDAAPAAASSDLVDPVIAGAATAALDAPAVVAEAPAVGAPAGAAQKVAQSTKAAPAAGAGQPAQGGTDLPKSAAAADTPSERDSAGRAADSASARRGARGGRPPLRLPERPESRPEVRLDPGLARLVDEIAGGAEPSGVPGAPAQPDGDLDDGAPFAGVRLSEIRVGGIAAGCGFSQSVYLEVEGPPGTILDGLTYVIIARSGPGLDGTIESAIGLRGAITADAARAGHFLLVDSVFCPNIGFQPDQVSQATFGRAPTKYTTHLLVSGFSGFQGQDLDFTNDCTLEVTPWAAVIDALSIQAGVPGCVYAAAGLGPSFGTPDPIPYHAFRCRPFGIWRAGLVNFGLPFGGGLDTPGFPNVTCADASCPGDGDCCIAHGGSGCDDEACCETVCSLLPYCCLVGWDAQCVSVADGFCFDCGGSGFQPLCPDDPTLGPCYAPHDGPLCEDLFCAALVCVELPGCCETQWDEGCVDAAFTRCICGNPFSFPCEVISGSPGCSDCDCCRTVCLISANCCSVGWDAFCVALASNLCTKCGDAGAGECCLFDATPACSDAACCEAVCAVDPACCLVTWDFGCAVQAASLCARCSAFGNPACGSCYNTFGGPGCEPKKGCGDVQCSIRTCAIDAYCCFVEWDDFCVEVALIVCVANQTCDDIDPGVSCAVPHPEPGCSQLGCCSVVCAVEPLCCTTAWDEMCVEFAFIFCFAVDPGICQTGCGNPCAQGCYSTSAQPGCDFGPCCFTVCAVAPSCCIAGWDASCTQIALLSCCGLPAAGSCFAVRGSPFCDDPSCCSSVCLLDAFCCDESWDEFCVELAFEQCPEYCFAPGDGRGCFVPSDAPGCGKRPPALGSAPICTSVCTVDPLCCRDSWDAACVQTALALYGTLAATGCSEMPCSTPHDEGGCAILSCCTAVCSVVPTCCSVSWDIGCVGLASILCVDSVLFAVPPVCPSDGDCFTAHANAGCQDPTCCTAVCFVDPSCCDGSWDSACVSLAGEVCGDFLPPFCIPNDRSCFAPHGEPYCRDALCSDLVCVFDPFCCEEAWDFACVQEALLFCTRGCGSEFSGPCVFPGTGPGCADFGCCERVCAFDDFCCSAIWDALCVQLAIGLCSTGPCFDAHVGKGCDLAEVALQVCLLDPECCELNWDSTCANSAQKLFPFPSQGQPGGCGDPALGSCFVPHPTRGCDNATCCQTVCAADSFCCESFWDATCVTRAKDLCAELWEETYFDCDEFCAGPCFRPKLTPNCADEECCDLVCADDTFCCTVEWDVLCAESAQFLCLECGDPETGSCCFPHLGPYCNDATCCDAVCAIDSFCCSLGGVWDGFCVAIAAQQCPTLCADLLACGAPFSGDCCSPGGAPYCNDAACCLAVCNIDSFCCEQSWDDACANQAQITCAALCALPSCGDPFAGSCFVVHPGPTCDDVECCEFVCTFFDSTCCTESWDVQCVKYAVSFCIPGVCGFPTSGDCFVANGTPGCDDLDCCNFICTVYDFFCCQVAWDQACADEASIFCAP
ncbi:MAG TPA: hypothetical protein PKC43_04175 [Phycisphaerales bacterium]|nr:hypothetical protein [Phycisphaerales bacterium]HMP36624.1 hypothetical protein [Phycisphaerales bacterium]